MRLPKIFPSHSEDLRLSTMKSLATVVLICVLLSEALQVCEALKCYQCSGTTCYPTVIQCSVGEDFCKATRADGQGKKPIEKGCATKYFCDAAKAYGVTSCCFTDLCNGAEGVYLNLLIMLGALLSSILFF